jgi:ADP-ribose diphosphatase
MEIYHGKRLSVETRAFRLPNGSEREKVVVHPGGAVAVLPLEGDSCYLVRQYRFAIDETILEAPAGTIDPGETPEETVRRELAEETGLKAGEYISLGYVFTTPGFSDERLHLFVARDLSPSVGHTPDEDEILEPVRVALPRFLEMCADGRISDAKTICLAFRYRSGLH